MSLPRSIKLKYATVERRDHETITRFYDGADISACSHPHLPDYHVIAERCGYSHDLEGYTHEHELIHSFLEEKLYDRPSRILWALAHGEPPPLEFLYEEIACQSFQAWLRGNVRPIVADCDWGALKREALELLA